MASGDDQSVAVNPRSSIRRFDVFAEYSRQERLDKGYPEDEAKGYGVWLAKVVAARRFGKSAVPSDRGKAGGKGVPEPEPRFRSLGDELQTDETFDHDIVDRMGRDFYDDVFVPAIVEARTHGESYEDIRDSIRKPWKPMRTSTK